MMAHLVSSLGVQNCLIEPSPEAQAPKGLHITYTLVRDHREVPVKVLNTMRRPPKLTKQPPGTL
jgi:hypothetical protein